MKKNIVFVIVLLLICSGCTSEYTISFDEKLNVTETLVALEEAEFFNQYNKSSVQRVIGFLLEPNLEYFNENGFSINQIYNSDKAGVRITNNYDSIEKYKDTSAIINQYGDVLEYIDNGETITLRIVGQFNADEQDQSGKYLVDSGKINIKLPQNVIEHNADKIDEKNNIYTWIISEPGVERELYITFNKEIKKDLTVLYVIIGGIIVLVISGFFFANTAIIKNKFRNKI